MRTSVGTVSDATLEGIYAGIAYVLSRVDRPSDYLVQVEAP
jgi:hypothetical protein